MTTHHTITLPSGIAAEARATWQWSPGTPGTLSDGRGWELLEFWVPGFPTLTVEERESVRGQLTEPEGCP